MTNSQSRPDYNPSPLNARELPSEIEKNIVAKNSASTYKDRIVLFVFYLLDNHREFLVDSNIATMLQLDTKDKEHGPNCVDGKNKPWSQNF